MSVRENIASNIKTVVDAISSPDVKLCTRQPFELEELSQAQYPAVIVQTSEENREDLELGSGANTRTGTIDVVFLGFQRESKSNLKLYYTEKGNSSTFETKDYEHKGGAQWLMANSGHLHTASSLTAIGSTTRPDGSTPQIGEPKYRFIPSGHLTINI